MEIAPVTDNTQKNRFETQLPDGDIAYVGYRKQDAALALEHTVVPEKWEGKGIAGAMVKQVLDKLRESSTQILPYCPYIAAWLKRHPDYSNMVAEDFPAGGN